jgi:hypothetical protein
MYCSDFASTGTDTDLLLQNFATTGTGTALLCSTFGFDKNSINFSHKIKL